MFKIKTVFSLVSVVLITMLFNGCGSTKQPSSAKVEEFPPVIIKTTKKPSEIKFYIDERLVKDRNKLLMQELANNLKAEPFTVKIVDKILVLDKSQKGKIVGKHSIGSLKIYNNTYGINSCIVNCEELTIKPEQIEFRDNEIFIKGLKNEKEILSTYYYIQKEKGFFEDNSIRKKYGIFPALYLDEESLLNKEFKLTSKYIENSTIKHGMKAMLENRGFNVVDNKEVADYSILVENLGYGQFKNIKRYIKAPIASDSFSKSMEFSAMKVGTTGLQYHSTGTSTGKASAALFGAGLLLSLLDNSGDTIITVNSFTVYDKQDQKIGQSTFPIYKYFDTKKGKAFQLKGAFNNNAIKALSNTAGFLAARKIEIQ